VIDIPNQLGKLDKPMFQSWMEILLRTEESYLWLIRRPPEAGKILSFYHSSLIPVPDKATVAVPVTSYYKFHGGTLTVCTDTLNC